MSKVEKRKAEMIELRKTGLSLKKIGDRYGISRERVRQIIGNTGYKYYKKVHDINKFKRKVKELREQHKTRKEIADILGMSEQTVYLYYGKLGKLKYKDGYRKCPKCKRILSEDSYYSEKCNTCIDCSKKSAREWYDNNREKAKTYQKKYYARKKIAKPLVC